MRWIPLALSLSLLAFFLAPVSAQEQPTPEEPAEEQPVEGEAAEQPAEEPTEEPSAEERPGEEPADEQPAEVEPAAEGEPAASGDAVAQFTTRLDELKAMLVQLRAWQVEYQAADPSAKADLETRYYEQVGKADALVLELQGPAEAAFAADPKGSGAAEYLAQLIHLRLLPDDQYEEAARLAQLLIDGGFDDPRIYDMGGGAAFQAGQFELAKTWLEKAKQAKVLGREPGEQFLENIDFYIDAWKTEQALREAEALADDLPRVLLKTKHGDITIELFENEAPNTVANFISLVEKKFYDGVPFHRVLPGFMAQGGDPTGTGGGGPGYNIACECTRPEHRLHFRGSLSMAHAGPNTGGSQFFLMFVPSGPASGYDLNGKHTVFGRLIEGLEVLGKITRRDPSQQNQPEPDVILEATVIRKRDHEYQPETLPE